MSARRNVPPPFEIMGASPPSPPTGPGFGSGSRPRGPGLRERWRTMVGGMSGTGLAGWWSLANRPVMLRMPRGYLLLAGVGILLLMTMAYWVGNVRGFSRAVSEMEDGGPGPGRIRSSEAPQAPEGSVIRSGAAAQAAGASTGRRDPREAGKNYLILARYPLDEAQRLVGFLKEQGVEAIGVPAHTRGLYLVIALRGFDRTEVNAESGTRFKDQMRRLGRAWLAENGGKGDDLASMYFSRYDPPPGTN